MESSERLALVIDTVQREGKVGVAQMAEVAGTSEMTIRRDLEQLAAQGLVRRVRGGAISLMLRGDEPPFNVRAAESTQAKVRIAAEVNRLLLDGEAVVIDSGTTGLEVARAIAGRRMTVVPLSLHAALALTSSAPTVVVIPGGELRPIELALVGPMTESGIRSLRFDTAVITCCGLSTTHGLTAHDLVEAAAKRAAIESSRRIVVAADAEKFARTALAAICAIDRIDVLITDSRAPANEVAAIERLGVEVRCV